MNAGETVNLNHFGDRVIRIPELEIIFGVCARTIRRKSAIGEFPPLILSGGVVGMLESKVKEHFGRLSAQTANCV
ncbi:MAG TPA: hypothetical protein VFY06_00655 [Verrucomicrobiae bacterium]|nr:hypothetical protein [Verrucomicrobiae bacterium]